MEQRLIPRTKTTNRKPTNRKPSRRSTRRTLAKTRATKMLAEAKKGLTFAEIGRRHGVSRERVRQVVYAAEPDFNLAKYRVSSPDQTRPAQSCAVCGQQVEPPRRRYCSQDCATAARMLAVVTTYQSKHIKTQARSTLRHSDDEIERRWARRVLRGQAGKRRWIMYKSKTYQILEKNGLLEQLPEGFEVRGQKQA